MKISLSDIEVCVINLPSSTSRMARTASEVASFFSSEDRPIHRIDGVRSPDLTNSRTGKPYKKPEMGIAAAHMSCVRMAKEMGWDQVMVLEDDVRFSPKSFAQAETCMSEVPDDYQILLGGIYHGDPKPVGLVCWRLVLEFCGLHCYVLNSSAYDRVLSFDMNHHIDRWMADPKRGGLTAYVSWPFFATQHAGFSDKSQQLDDWDFLLQKYRIV